jgi:hypothetical protein
VAQLKKVAGARVSVSGWDMELRAEACATALSGNEIVDEAEGAAFWKGWRRLVSLTGA